MFMSEVFQLQLQLTVVKEQLMPNKRYLKRRPTAQRSLLVGCFFVFHVLFILKTEKCLSKANGLELLVKTYSGCNLGADLLDYEDATLTSCFFAAF